ncbi:hypothetical protein HDU97_001655 [Phlyctochytrium planicorne]|nr:hypothetical protein HDU97_001655 [Phlyctochytrium planicorne]
MAYNSSNNNNGYGNQYQQDAYASQYQDNYAPASPRSPGGSRRQQQQQQQYDYNNQAYGSYDSAYNNNAVNPNAYGYENYDDYNNQAQNNYYNASNNQQQQSPRSPRSAGVAQQPLEYQKEPVRSPKPEWEQDLKKEKYIQDNLFAGLPEEKKRKCTLVPTKMWHWIVLAVVATFVVVFGVIGYFFWPALPQIRVNEIIESAAKNSVSAYSFSLPADANGNYNRMQISLSLRMNLSVYNPNLYALNVELVDLGAFLNVNETAIKIGLQPKDIKPDLTPIIGPAPVGRDPNYLPNMTPKLGSGNKTNIVFPSRQNVTFEMDFLLSYTPDTQLGLLLDPTFKEFCQVCGITTSRGRVAKVSYAATSTVSFLKSFGYKPQINGQVSISCPIASGYLEDLVNYSTSHPNATAQEIIEQVFSTKVQP